MLPLAFNFATNFGTLYPELIIDLSDDVPGDVTHKEEPKRLIKMKNFSLNLCTKTTNLKLTTGHSPQHKISCFLLPSLLWVS